MLTRFSLFILSFLFCLPLLAQELPLKLHYHDTIVHAYPEQDWKQVDSLLENGLPRQALTQSMAVADEAYETENLRAFARSMFRINEALRSARFESDTLQNFLYAFAQKAFSEQSPYSNFRFAYLEEWLGAYNFRQAIQGGDKSLDWPGIGKLDVDANGLQALFASHVLDNPETLMRFSTQEIFGDKIGGFYITPFVIGLPEASLFEHFVQPGLSSSYTYYNASNNPPEEALFGETDALIGVSLASDEDQQAFRSLYHLEKLNDFTKRFQDYAEYVIYRLELARDYNESMKSEKRDSLYLAACRRFKKKLEGNPASAVFARAIAQTLSHQAASWHYANNPIHADGFNEAIREIDASLSEFPESESAQSLRALRAEILEANIRFSFRIEPKQGKPALATIRYRNIDAAWMTIYKVNSYGKENYPNHLRGMSITKLSSEKLTFENGMAHLYHDKDFIIPAFKESGDYFFVVSDTPENAGKLFVIDTLSKLKNVSYQAVHVGFLQMTLRRGEKTSILVNDLRTGEPVRGASVYVMKLYAKHPKKQLVGKTDANGMAFFSKEKTVDYERYEFSAYYQGDSIVQNHYSYREYEENDGNRYRLFTDRAIYRPGQQVFFKILGIKPTDDYYRILTGNNATILFTDANNTELYRQELKTNEFGSAHSSFALPVGGFLPGMIYISVNGQSAGFIRVEEYKRPTFEITFDAVEQAYSFGDSVEISGNVNALAGYPVSDAKVSITVSRQLYFFRWYDGPQNTDEEPQLYEVITDREGRFKLKFFAEKGKGYYGMQYNVVATASDPAGETHEASTSISIGEQALNVVFTNQQDHYRSDETNKLGIRVQNAEGQLQKDETVFYILKRVQKDGRIRLNKAEYQHFSPTEFEKQFPGYTFSDRTQRTEQATGNLHSGDSVNLNQVTAGKDGYYELGAFVISKAGDTSFTTFSFNYLDMQEHRHESISGLLLSFKRDTEFEAGKKLHFTIGAEGQEVPVLLSYYNTEGLISTQWLHVNGSTGASYTPGPNDKNGLVVQVLAYIKGQPVIVARQFSYTDPNRYLDIKLETRRDYLRPGAAEKWILTVRDTSGRINDAELLATLYDASLDQFSQHGWNNGFGRYFSVPSEWERNYNSVLLASGNSWPQSEGFFNPEPVRGFYGFRTVNAFASYDRSTVTEAKTREMVPNEEDVARSVGMNFNTVGGVVSGEREKKDSEQAEADQSPKPELKVRENFNETAFFYPDVYAQPDSTYRLEFTLPDALTRWKLLTFAHTKDLQYGSEQLTFEARKELMVQANAPRFFRENDRFIFQAKVINTSSKAQEVRVQLTLSDPFTGKELTSLFGALDEQSLFIDSASSKEISWELQIPESVSVVSYDLKAIGADFADGERRTIPILSNRMLIRTARPFVKTGTGASEFDFKALSELSPSAEKLNLAIRLQTQTVLSALMALPYVMEYPYECSEQVFARYFSNALAQKIIRDNPEFKRIVNSWKQDDPGAFVSALAQNEELKNIILLETPWVLEAQNESAEKAHLEALFNENQLNRELKATFDKLKDQKANDGGWGWWKARESNPYITQHIVSGLGRLKKLGITFDESICSSALDYLDTHYLEQYGRLSEKQKKDKAGLSEMTVHYLAARRYFDRPDNEATRYYQSLLNEQWTGFSLQAQALTGMAAMHAGNSQLAEKIRASLLDKSTFRPEQGRYWVNNTYGYYWNHAPVETHSTIMEFFNDMGNMEKELREMQLWLIQQKRSTSWETTRASTLACNALLLVKPGTPGTREVQVSLGNGTPLPVNVQSPENSFTYSGSEINESLAHIRVESNSAEPITGAFHLTYLEDLDQVHNSDGTFRLERHYYIVGKDGERALKNGEQVPAGTRLKVKILLTAGQDLEYVHVKDSKAAGFEAVETLSGYKYGKLYYFQTNKDASTDFFIDYLPKGSYYFEYELFVTGSGDLSVGPATAECMYAPEFRANTAGMKVHVR